MIPRQRLDIEWSDLLAGGLFCLNPGSALPALQEIASHWNGTGEALVTLSVRSGFDALLTSLDLPPGSEVLVSALTIQDMISIISSHNLVAVPVDLDVDELKVKEANLQRAVTSRTRMILVAHLYGCRMPLDGVATIAQQHALILVEDCAQAYNGDGFRGHPQSDVTCFSFGPIKTATALGGGLLRFKDPALCARVRQLQDGWPQQSRWRFWKRVLRYAQLKFLNARPCFTVFVWLCGVCRINYDVFLQRSVRGFGGGNLLAQLRHRPCVPLIRLLARRLRQTKLKSVSHRVSRAHDALTLLSSERTVGARAPEHSHWVFPIQTPTPDELKEWLWRHGFDATRGASSMIAVSSTGESSAQPENVRSLMQRMLYLPVATCRNAAEVRRLCDCVKEFEDPRHVSPASPESSDVF